MDLPNTADFRQPHHRVFVAGAVVHPAVCAGRLWAPAH